MPRGHGHAKAKAKAPPTRKATPPPQVSSREEDHLPTDPVERSPQQETQMGNDMPPMKCKKALPLNLTREQEVSIIEWLKDHPELFDKSDASYKDSVMKKAMWNAKAEGLGQGSVVLLPTWYHTMRTRYGKLNTACCRVAIMLQVGTLCLGCLARSVSTDWVVHVVHLLTILLSTRNHLVVLVLMLGIDKYRTCSPHAHQIV